MTPLQLFLTNIVFILFCYWIDDNSHNKNNNRIKLFGGMNIVSLFISIIWAIFHYIKF